MNPNASSPGGLDERTTLHDDSQQTPAAMVSFTPHAPIEFTPVLGQEFNSEEEAYTFYNAYARCCGFSIRKSDVKRSKNGEICSRILKCSKEGLRQNKENVPRKRRERSITRCECLASLVIKRTVSSSKWRITGFKAQHSHRLETPTKSRCLRSHRSVPDSQLHIVEGLHKVGVGVSRSLEFMIEEVGGRDQLGFTEVDLRNALRSRRMSKYGVGATSLLDYFQKQFNEKADYFYEIQVDQQNRLMSFVWADGDSKKDYQVFGDVVCFDTTYRTNEYDMPFGPFVGVNHHKQSVLLGAGLLFGESETDFTWLFQTWLHAMGGVPPKAIITDQDPAISKAISLVFPTAKHIFCAWHIYKKFPEKLQSANQQYPQFKDAFMKLIQNTEDIEVFESGWVNLMTEYGLSDHLWLQQMYNVREKWVPAYTRSVFLAGMITTQRSESINAFFGHFVGPTTKLLEFVEAYERAVTKRREDEKDADCNSTYGTPVLKTKYVMEEQIAKLYTREIFFEFQGEMENSQYYMPKSEVVDESRTIYEMHKYGDPNYRRLVTWCDETQVGTCSCRLFDWCGIVCRHMLSMFRWRGIISMPEHHLLHRWSQRPKEKIGLPLFTDTCDATNSAMVRRHVALPKINFILHELTSNWESFKIANAGLDNVIAALWEQKQSHVLAGCSNEQRLALTYGSERRTSQDSNHAHENITMTNNAERNQADEVDGSCIGEVQHMSGDNEPNAETPVMLNPNVVRSKGRQRKRFKSSLEKATTRTGRLCRGCKKIVVGHDRRNCPELLKKDDAQHVAMNIDDN